MFVVGATTTHGPRTSIIAANHAMADLDDTSRLISISLDEAGPPISGTLSSGAEPPRCFTGWLSLLAELQAAVDGAAHVSKSSWSEPR
jgi:hypothetical protein